MLRAGLRLAEFPYACAVAARNRRFDRRPNLVQRVPVPVVSIGNLTTGGTGKTPLVRWVCETLIRVGAKPAIVSRGYRGRDGVNDEMLELADALPGIPQVQNPRRYRGAMQAIEEFSADSVVLDDGFQHRFLARDLDIVLLDALCPFGYEHLLPRGFLRESVAALARADVVGLSRADQVDETQRCAIRARVERIAPRALWVELSHQPAAWRSLAGAREPLSKLASRRVAAFCGIGNPQAFVKSLQQAGCEVAGLQEFPDHHAYTAADVERLQRWAQELAHVDALVCTMKDRVKLIKIPEFARLTIWSLEVQVSLLTGGAELQSCIEQLASRRQSQ